MRTVENIGETGDVALKEGSERSKFVRTDKNIKPLKAIKRYLAEKISLQPILHQHLILHQHSTALELNINHRSVSRINDQDLRQDLDDQDLN